MGRTTVYNNITTPEKINSINSENRTLIDDFLNYLESVGRAQTTIKNYRADLLIFFCWVLEDLNNKRFVDITKREIARFQNKAIKDWGWSSNRLRTVKAAVSSLGNYIENILDDDYAGFRSIVRKIESPPNEVVREKTVWENGEIENLLAALIEKKDYEKACFIALAAYGGRRKSELCRFKVSDFANDKLVFNGFLYKSDPIKTKGRGNGKMLNCYTLAKMFKPYFDMWMQFREENGIKSEWLFPSRNSSDEQLSVSTVDGWIPYLSKLSGKPLYMHSFRHAFVTYLLKSGLPETVVQTILGWKSSEMLRVYDDRSEDEQIGEYFLSIASDDSGD